MTQLLARAKLMQIVHGALEALALPRVAGDPDSVALATAVAGLPPGLRPVASAHLEALLRLRLLQSYPATLAPDADALVAGISAALYTLALSMQLPLFVYITVAN